MASNIKMCASAEEARELYEAGLLMCNMSHLLPRPDSEWEPCHAHAALYIEEVWTRDDTTFPSTNWRREDFGYISEE